METYSSHFTNVWTELYGDWVNCLSLNCESVIDLRFEPRHSDYRMSVSNYSALNKQINEEMKQQIEGPLCPCLPALWLRVLASQWTVLGRSLHYQPGHQGSGIDRRVSVLSRAPWKCSASLLDFQWLAIVVKHLDSQMSQTLLCSQKEN